jgi:microcystin-dependent protein
MDPFMGEILIFSFDFAPRGWAACNGQLMKIVQNSALYALLGTMYGGDGKTTFALPDLQGRVPLDVGAGFAVANKGGEVGHQLSSNEVPAHTHPVYANSLAPTLGSPSGGLWAQGENAYQQPGPADVTMNQAALGSAGGDAEHTNLQPYLTLNFMIAVMGLFPMRD